MRFGLTHRELTQYTQRDKPDVSKRGGIDEVVDVLIEHYEVNR